MVLRKRESRSPPSYYQVEALPARLLGGLFVSLYRVNAALFRRGCGFVLYHANAALFPRAGGALPLRSQRCFVASAMLFVLPVLACCSSRRAALRFVGVSRLCSRKHSRRRWGEYRNINTPESHAELSGVCRFLICGDVLESVSKHLLLCIELPIHRFGSVFSVSHSKNDSCSSSNDVSASVDQWN